MVPLIIALPRALHFWTRAAYHRRKVSKLRPTVWVAKILPRSHRSAFALKIPTWTFGIPEIGAPTLVRTVGREPVTSILRTNFVPWTIGKLAGRTGIRAIRPRGHIPPTGPVKPAVGKSRLVWAKTIRTRIPIIAEVARTLPVIVTVFRVWGCGGRPIRVVELSRRKRRTRLLGKGGARGQQNSGKESVGGEFHGCLGFDYCIATGIRTMSSRGTSNSITAPVCGFVQVCRSRYTIRT